MRAVVYGATGLVGRHLVRELVARRRAVSCPKRLPLPDYLNDVTHVFNAIGFTDIERAEREPKKAFQANEEWAQRIAAWGRDLGVIVVHISTEFVFDGNPEQRPFCEWDEPQPRSVYATSKRAGELAAAAVRPTRLHIVRLQNLFGAGGSNLLSRLCGAGTGAANHALDNERAISPMWAGTAARILCDIAESGRFGLWHVAARGATTYSGLAKRLAVPHRAVRTQEIDLRVPRPSIALNCLRLGEARMAPPPTWQDSVAEYLETKKNQSA